MNTSVKLTDSLTLTHVSSGGHRGFWLYDKLAGANLAMRAENEISALLGAISYYQRRLATVEGEFKILQGRVDRFLEEFEQDDQDDQDDRG